MGARGHGAVAVPVAVQMTEAPLAPFRDLARVSVGLSAASILSALFGAIAFAVAIVLGDHFNVADPRSAALLLVWLVLLAVTLSTWSAACGTAALARARARRAREPGGATTAVVMALAVPVTWAVELALAVIWFGIEALSGPWPM